MRYSIIVPVYNRPQEIDELLSSLAVQRFKDFEVLIIEDGSSIPSAEIVEKYKNALTIRYFMNAKAGPSPQRNFGFEQVNGQYMILFDSDLIVPAEYFEILERELAARPLDAFGGSDRAHPSFTTLQKAINYTMTSFITTGGIRGNKQHVGKFHPRSFNMGLTKQVYQTIGGFIDMHPGEDIDFSIRIIKAGFQVGLIHNAYVFHKRRATIKQFFRQVYRFGYKRIELFKIHPSELKLTHLFPTAFCIYVLLSIISSIVFPVWGYWTMFGWIGYLLAIAIHSTIINNSLLVGLLSVQTTMVQMVGYGWGITKGLWQKVLFAESK
jgi:glycosyltransferase involved in cell wall biosynthesis